MSFSLRLGLEFMAPRGGFAPPKPVISAPLNSAFVFIGETVTVSATVSGTVDRIDWVANPGGGEVVIATDNSSPFSQSWTVGLATGNHTLVARSVKGASHTDSDPISITVARATLESVRYVTGTPTFTTPANFLSPTLARSVAKIRCWGGGAGGTTATGAGGGGEYRESDVALTPNTGYTFSIAATTAANTNGAATTFNTTGVVANGGLSGANGGTGGTGGTGTIGFNGGNGGVGAGNTSGGGGAGSRGAGSGTNGGQAEGGFGSTATAGRNIGAGGGSSAASGLGGGRGQGGPDYMIDGTNFPCRNSFKEGRDQSSTTSRAVTMPDATSLDANGDTFILKVGADAAGVGTTISVSGWTQVGAQVDDGTNACSLAIFKKTAAGGDTATIVTSTSVQVSYVVERWKNVTTVEFTSATGNSTNANPPNHSLTLGSAANVAWHAICVVDAASTAFNSFPTSYNGHNIVHPNSDVGVILASAIRYLNASAENPGTFGTGNEQWCAITLALY